MNRIIGIHHRTKRTVEGEARPTLVSVFENEQYRDLEIADDTGELDFVRGRFPVKFEKVNLTDPSALYDVAPHHVIWTKATDKDDLMGILDQFKKQEGKVCFVARKVPAAYDGLQAGDIIVMVLGGSGDRLAYALSNRGDKIDAQVFRLPPKEFKERKTAEYPARSLVEIFQAHPEKFHLTKARDRELIALAGALQARIDAMKARIACEQRIRTTGIGRIFCNPDGEYPQGSLDVYFQESMANDAILQALVTEETKRLREMTKLVEDLYVYEQLLSAIEGCGPAIASRLIVAIGDIRRFPTDAKLKAFCGVHVLPDGRMPRRRSGELANWHPDARQALYLLGDQFNRRPASVWGQKLLEYKARLKAKYPEPITDERGVKKFTPGHLHKMAVWKTLAKFVEWLWKEWWALERQHLING